MPTYEYLCAACGFRFEKFQSITASSTRMCPECGKRRVKRLLGTGGALIFKGSGFYATDYRSSSYAEDAKKDKEAAKGKGGSGKSESESGGASSEGRGD